MFVNRYLVPWMSLAATGCLWIGDAEHAARLKEADTGVEQTLPTDTATPVEVDLRLEPVQGVIGACGEDGELRGSVDGAALSSSLTASLAIGPLAPVSVDLRLTDSGDRATFVLPVSYDDDLACDATGCRHPIELSVGDEVETVQADFLPSTVPEVDDARLDGTDVGDAAELTVDADAELIVTVSDARLTDGDEVTLVACPSGDAPDDGTCTELVSAGSIDEGEAEITVGAEPLQSATCGVDSLAALDLYVEATTACGDHDLTVASDLTFPGDCDGDQSLYADDCNDFSSEQLPGADEACDDVDRDCSGDPYDVVTYTASGGTVTVPRDQLAEALLDADADTTVHLCGGTFTGTVELPGTITLAGVMDGATLDGAGSGPVVDAALTQVPPMDRPMVGLSHLTITGGSGTNGGGVQLAFVEGVFDDVVIEGNSADSGGGVHVEASNLSLTDVRIEGNTASDDGGGLFMQSGLLDLVRSDVIGNEAGSVGGGMMLRDVEATLDDDSSIADNDATQGGGLTLVGGIAPCSLVGGTVSGNTADQGAGFSTLAGAEGQVVDTSLDDNVASGDGGAFYVTGGETVFTGSWDGNTAMNGRDGYVGASGTFRMECAAAMGIVGFANADGPQSPLMGELCQTLGETGGWVTHACTCTP